MGYIVTAPMALIDLKDDTIATVYRGGAVPENVTDEHLAHLKKFGLVAEGKVSGGLAPTRAGDGSELDNSGSESASVESEPGSEDEDKPPATSAPKAEWVAYATDHGLSKEEAEASTKEQLIEQVKG